MGVPEDAAPRGDGDHRLPIDRPGDGAGEPATPPPDDPAATPRQEDLLTDQALSDADQAISARDQRRSDADQVAADAEARSADAEQARADSDQRFSDAEQDAADARLAANPDAETRAAIELEISQRDHRSAQRAASAVERDLAERLREVHTQERSGDSTRRDATAAARDGVSERRDVASMALEDQTAHGEPSGLGIAEAAEARGQAAADRTTAAQDRRSAAATRARELIRTASIAIETSRAEDREGDALSADLVATIGELLPGAASHREFSLHYQPLRELATNRVLGFEALLRWTSPELGNVPPDHFIPVAEASGQIVEIGEWVLGHALRRLHWWRSNFAEADLGMSVNVAPEQLVDAQFAEVVHRVIREAAVPAHAVTLEVTERTLVADQPSMHRTMQELRDLQVKLAVDDFGTGFSSLGRLAALPLDELKIDRIFIDGIDTDKRHRALVAGVLAMSRTLDLRVVAEGIETDAQRATLIDLGCEVGQGHALGRPTDASAATELLQRPAGA